MNDPHSEPLREGKSDTGAALRRSRKAARATGEAVVAAEEATRAIVPEIPRAVVTSTDVVARVVPTDVRRQGWEGTISRALIAHSPLAIFLRKAS